MGRRKFFRKHPITFFFSVSPRCRHRYRNILFSLYFPYTAPLKYQAPSIPSNLRRLVIITSLDFVTLSAYLEPLPFAFTVAGIVIVLDFTDVFNTFTMIGRKFPFASGIRWAAIISLSVSSIFVVFLGRISLVPRCFPYPPQELP